MSMSAPPMLHHYEDTCEDELQDQWLEKFYDPLAAEDNVLCDVSNYNHRAALSSNLSSDFDQ